MGRAKAADVGPPDDKAPDDAVEVEANVVGEPQGFVDRLNRKEMDDEEFVALPLHEQWGIFKEWLKLHLVSELHYGRAIEVAKVDTLLQAGAEHICNIVGIVPVTELDDSPMTNPAFAHGDFVTVTTVTAPEVPPRGVPLPVSVRGQTVRLWGSGNQTMDKNNNTAIQKSAKRSFVAAVKRLFGLSDMFVLEAEGMQSPPHEGARPHHSTQRIHEPDKVTPDDVEWAEDGGDRYPVLPDTYKVANGDEPSMRIMKATWKIAEMAGVKWTHRYASYLIHLAGSFVKVDSNKDGTPTGKGKILMDPLYRARGDLRNVSPKWRNNIGDTLEGCIDEGNIAALIDEMDVKRAELRGEGPGYTSSGEARPANDLEAAQQEADQLANDLPF